MKTCPRCKIKTEYLFDFNIKHKDKKGNEIDNIKLCSACYDWLYSRTTNKDQIYEFMVVFFIYMMPFILIIYIILKFISKIRLASFF